MGSISAFKGIVVYMYPEKGGKHHRAHIHAFHGGSEAVVAVPEGEVIESDADFPVKKLRLVQAWVYLRTEELMANWELCLAGKNVVWVDPIR